MKKFVSSVLITLSMVTPSFAQEAPAPRRMPRTPVRTEKLEEEQHNQAPTSRELSGQAVILDAEKLRIGKTDIRLFGIVPPQLSASFGPQARAYLDALVGNQVIYCKIRDRDRDGRLLATCLTSSGTDIALDLVKHGFAVVARGSIGNTGLGPTYVAAEQAAQAQKTGLWSLAPSAPPAAQIPAPKLVEPTVAEETTPKKDEKSSAHGNALQIQEELAEETISPEAELRIDQPLDRKAGFVERYQILLSGLAMLLAAAGFIESARGRTAREKRDEIRALAAALRGELMAARSICINRARSITNEDEDRATAWPRLRAMLYQAYVGRLGMLGAELARQVSSIYGQATDYAALYNPAASGSIDAPKKQALETLVKHIDEVLPKLARIEKAEKISFPARTSAHRKETNERSGPMEPTETEAVADPVPPPKPQTVTVKPSGPSIVMRVLSSFAGTTLSFLRNVMESLKKRPQHVEEGSAPQQQPIPFDPNNVAEYTALIEADMERYQYVENIDQDPEPPRRRGERKQV